MHLEVDKLAEEAAREDKVKDGMISFAYVGQIVKTFLLAEDPSVRESMFKTLCKLF